MMTETFYKRKLLKKVSEGELNEWLERNPPPKYFFGGKYAWAFLEMPVGNIFTFIRKNFKGYKNI